MSSRPFLFDASSVFVLMRELLGEAPDLLWGNSSISLVYYEVGNALWRECFLLARIVPEEASKLLKSMFSILRTMEMTLLEDEDLGKTILDMAGKLNISFYDAAYLAEAQRSDKVLVTDDEKLAGAAEKVGVKTLTSKTLLKQLPS